MLLLLSRMGNKAAAGLKLLYKKHSSSIKIITMKRSVKHVIGYKIGATDGDVGTVKNFLFEDSTWTIRYLVVNTHNWWPGKRILVPPQWIKRLSWGESKVYVDLDRESIKSAPRYESSSLITREFEQGLYGHYGRPGYWNMDPIEQNSNGKSQKS